MLTSKINKTVDFKNAFFKNKVLNKQILNQWRLIMILRKKIKRSVITNLSALVQVLFLMQKAFYNGREIILEAFENDIFPLPKQYLWGMEDWKEDDMDSSEYLPKKDESSTHCHHFSLKKELKKRQQKLV